MENPRKRTVLLAEHIAENHTDLYAAFKNTFEVKLVSSSNATFYADCVLNNIPFLFLLGKCNNFKTRIRSFVQKFKPSRYVILFSDNWSMYKEAVLCGNDKAASAEKNKFIPMYFAGRTATDIVNSTITFSNAKSNEKTTKIKEYVSSVKDNATTFSKDQLVSALASTMQIPSSDAESILICYRTLFNVSEAVGRGKEFLLMQTPIDKEKIDVLYDMFTKHRI